MPRLMPRKGKQWGGGGEGLCFQTNTPKTETPVSPPPRSQAAPWGLRAHDPTPTPLPVLGQPRLPPERWEKMAQTSEEGNKYPHSSSWKEMPSSGEGEQRTWLEGARVPPPTLAKAVQYPHPAPV